MFEYPISLPKDTQYDKLEIDPTATAEEVRQAKNRIAERLSSQRKQLERQLANVYSKVPGLQVAESEVESLQLRGSGDDMDQLAKTQAELKTLVQEAVKIDPDYRQLQEQIREIETLEQEINMLPLLSTEERRDYDRSNPPLELIKIADCSHHELSDNKVALALLRRELSAFLAEKGEDVFFPSDLYRQDFERDFDVHPLLDGE